MGESHIYSLGYGKDSEGKYEMFEAMWHGDSPDFSQNELMAKRKGGFSLQNHWANEHGTKCNQDKSWWVPKGLEFLQPNSWPWHKWRILVNSGSCKHIAPSPTDPVSPACFTSHSVTESMLWWNCQNSVKKEHAEIARFLSEGGLDYLNAGTLDVALDYLGDVGFMTVSYSFMSSQW